jgi:hypothetical protein
VLRCPALGPSPTVTCPLRELLKTATTRVRPAIDEENVPDFVDDICVKHSVSFDTAKNRRSAQAFEYGTKEWDEFHTHARNSIESLNNQIKSGGTEDIESASRRRVRGFGAAQVIVTMLLTNFNLRKIAAFISDKIKADAKMQINGEPVVGPIRRRDREWHNPLHGHLPGRCCSPRQGETHSVRRDRRATATDLTVPPRTAYCPRGRNTQHSRQSGARENAFTTEDHKHNSRIATTRGSENRLNQKSLLRSLRSDFFFVSTGPFREEFRERPFGRADRI